MVFLLELKEGFKKFYNKYDTYLVPAVRFVMALVSFLMLNASIGYMSKLKNPLIAVAMAVLCAFLPNGFMIFFLSVFMLVHLYAISAEFAFNVSAVLPFYTEAGVSFSDYGTALLDKNAVPASNCGGAVL